MKKKLFSIFMVFTLCFVSVDQVYADAGSIVVGGSAIAGIGAGVIAGPTVVAVFCAMMAFGMNIELTEASQQAGMTKTEFLKNKIEQYCNEAQISANTFNNYILDQANVFQDGAISITNQAGNLIQKFCNWLFESDQVSNTAEFTGTSVNLLGLNCPVVRVGDTAKLMTYTYNANITINYKYADGSPLFVLFGCKINSHTEIYAVTNDTNHGNVVFETYDSNGRLFSRSQGVSQFGEYYANNIVATDDRYLVFDGVVPIFQDMSLNDVLSQVTEWPISSVTTNQDVITGDESQYDVSKQVLNPTQDQTIVINPNITITGEFDKDITIDVNEYLDTIKDYIDGIADDIITGIDDATGVPISIDIDPTIDWDPTIEKENDTDLPPDDEKTPVVKDDIIPYDFNPDPLKFDLKGIFPFCIPWDVKDMLSKLNASPVAPSYTVNWYIPIINQRLIFTVDLSPYNDVASTCRNMELLVLCIGLAIVTRQLFLRG